MKKIIMAIAVVTVGMTVSAATFNWGNISQDIVSSTGAGYDDNTGANLYSDATMFLYLGTVTYTAGEGFSGLVEGNLVASSGFIGDPDYFYGANGASSTMINAGATAANQAYTLILIDNTTYTSASDIQEGDMFVLRTGTSDATYFDPESSSYVALLQDTNAVAQTDWQAYSIPEPTSGLLLLLGMAGLALKRKIA